MPRKTQAPVRRPPLPTLPNRVFETPWEELAVAYESLPVPDPSARLRWLFRASEVWETGGKDIVQSSANNFYLGVSLADLKGFNERYRLNSRVIMDKGKLIEQVYRAGTPDGRVPPGLYAEYLRKL